LIDTVKVLKRKKKRKKFKKKEKRKKIKCKVQRKCLDVHFTIASNSHLKSSDRLTSFSPFLLKTLMQVKQHLKFHALLITKSPIQRSTPKRK